MLSLEAKPFGIARKSRQVLLQRPYEGSRLPACLSPPACLPACLLATACPPACLPAYYLVCFVALQVEGSLCL